MDEGVDTSVLVAQAPAECPHLARVGHVRQVNKDPGGPGVIDRRGRLPGALGVATDYVYGCAQAGEAHGCGQADP
jgi:hypothetical protein